MLSFSPRGVLDEILNLIESVSEEFPSYSCEHQGRCKIVFFSSNRVKINMGYLQGTIRFICDFFSDCYDLDGVEVEGGTKFGEGSSRLNLLPESKELRFSVDLEE